MVREYEVAFYATGAPGDEQRTRRATTTAYDARDAVFQVRAPFERVFPGRTFHLVSVRPAVDLERGREP